MFISFFIGLKMSTTSYSTYDVYEDESGKNIIKEVWMWVM